MQNVWVGNINGCMGEELINATRLLGMAYAPGGAPA